MSVYCAVHAVYVYLQLMQTVRFSSVLVRLGFAWVQCFQDMLWSEEIFEARGGVVVFGPDIFCCGCRSYSVAQTTRSTDWYDCHWFSFWSLWPAGLLFVPLVPALAVIIII